MPWETPCATRNAVLRWKGEPDSPQCGRKWKVFMPRSSLEGSEGEGKSVMSNRA